MLFYPKNTISSDTLCCLMDRRLMLFCQCTGQTAKAEAHFCSDLNYGVPSGISLTDGNGAERPFAEK